MECQHFIEQLDALSTWVRNTRELLETQRGPVGSVTDHDEQDSVVVDPTVSVRKKPPLPKKKTKKKKKKTIKTGVVQTGNVSLGKFPNLRTFPTVRFGNFVHRP